MRTHRSRSDAIDVFVRKSDKGDSRLDRSLYRAHRLVDPSVMLRRSRWHCIEEGLGVKLGKFSSSQVGSTKPRCVRQLPFRQNIWVGSWYSHSHRRAVTTRQALSLRASFGSDFRAQTLSSSCNEVLLSFARVRSLTRGP